MSIIYPARTARWTKQGHLAPRISYYAIAVRQPRAENTLSANFHPKSTHPYAIFWRYGPPHDREWHGSYQKTVWAKNKEHAITVYLDETRAYLRQQASYRRHG